MGMTFKPRVITVNPDQEFSWSGRLFIPGLFDGRHIFTILPLDDSRTMFIQREKFTGIMVPLFWLIGIIKNTRDGFEAMNQALKERAEQE